MKTPRNLARTYITWLNSCLKDPNASRRCSGILRPPHSQFTFHFIPMINKGGRKSILCFFFLSFLKQRLTGLQLEILRPPCSTLVDRSLWFHW